MTAINRIGETNYNNYGSKITIIEYKDANHIIVQFENNYIIKAQYHQFKKGTLFSPYCKTVYGVGYLGEGIYKPYINNKLTKTYKKWNHMLERCYDEKCLLKHPTYKDCTVCEEWHNFQTFAEWYDENYYEVDNEEMHLDKDILYKSNKVYSPKTCIFVPSSINILFVTNNTTRGNFPIGVSYYKRYNNYLSQCQYKRKNIFSGYFNTPEEAFYKGYKPYKEKLIKQIADTYKDRIPQKLHEAMYGYEVEITD